MTLMASKNCKYGCEVLAEGNPPLVDIVFVHGLNGDPHESWTKTINHDRALSVRARFFKSGTVTKQSPEGRITKKRVCWPKDLLPGDLPAARIISYGYCGEVARFLKPSSKHTLFSLGQDLVTRLQLLRDKHKEENRPLIFVAYSLGGLVVKDALQYSQSQQKVQQHLHSIYLATYGVVFFGTPHRGGRMVTLANIVANVVKIGFHDVNLNLLASLKQDSETLERLNESFSRMLHPDVKGLKIHSFREGLPMSVIGFIGKAVTDESAIMGHATEGKGYINASHTEMCRFADRNNPDYLLVLDVLRRFVHEANASMKAFIGSGRYRTGGSESKGSKPQGFTHPIQSHQGEEIFLRGESSVIESNGLVEHRKEKETVSADLGFLPNHYFTGREREIDFIDKSLRLSPSSGQRLLVLYGLGGVGKSQIAAEYSRRCASNFSGVFWINGRNYNTALLSYRTFANQVLNSSQDRRCNGSSLFCDETLLGLHGWDSTSHSLAYLKDTCEAVKTWLARPSNKDWLLIFDNADDLEDLDLLSLIPTVQHGHVILTSRRRQTLRLGTSLEVDIMTEEDAVNLLLKSSNLLGVGSNVEMPTASLIAKDMGYLPLALDQAGAFIAKTRISLKEYRRLITTDVRRSLAQKPADLLWPYQDTVFTTWNVSLDRIQRENQASWELLILCSFLAHEEISFDLLKFGCLQTWKGQYEFLPLLCGTTSTEGYVAVTKRSRMLNLPMMRRLTRRDARSRLLKPAFSENITSSAPLPLDWLRHLTSEEAHFREALGTLFDSCLVKESKDNHGISIHPLVHCWLRERLDSDERLLKSVEAVFLVSQAVEVSLEGHKGQIVATRVDVHVESCIVLLEHLASLPVLECEYGLCESMIRLAGVLMERQKSEMLFKESLRRIERHPKDLKMLKHAAIHGHAKLREAEGLRDEAGHLYTNLLKEEIAELGEEDPRSMWTLNCLATIYARDGRAAEARPMLQKVLHFREHRTEKSSSGTLCVLNNLAFVCLEQGRFPEARDLLKSALEMVERSPDLATFLTAVHVNTARMWEQSGEVERADACLRTAVTEATKQFGNHHRLAIAAIESCSLLACRRGMLSEAIDLEHKVFETKTVSVGLSHRSTIETLQRLAQLYWQQGDTTQAEIHFKQLLSIQIKQFGDEDARTLGTMNSLGLIYWDCGDLNAAVEQFENVLRAQERSQDKDHAALLLTQNNLGVALKDAGRLDESAKILESCAERAKSICGTDSIEYLVLVDSLGRLYQAQSNPKASKAMFQESLAGKQNVLGHRHPLTLSTLHNLAVLSADQGEASEAQRLFREAFSGKVLTFGLGSPYTVKTAYHLQGGDS